MNLFTFFSNTYSYARGYNIINNSIGCMSLYVAYTKPELRNLGVQTFILTNVPTILNYLSRIKSSDKYKKYVEKMPLVEIQSITNFLAYGKLLQNLGEIRGTITALNPNSTISTLISITEPLIGLKYVILKYSLISSCVIVATGTVVKSYLKRQLNNILSCIPNYHHILNILSNISADALATAIKNVSEGQSLNINVTTQDNEVINIISMPRKISISEEKLEEILPKCCPNDENYDLTKLQFDQTSCGICREPFDTSAKLLRILKCGHAYHCGCVDSWFFAGHLDCPTCQKKIDLN